MLNFFLWSPGGGPNNLLRGESLVLVRLDWDGHAGTLRSRYPDQGEIETSLIDWSKIQASNGTEWQVSGYQQWQWTRRGRAPPRSPGLAELSPSRKSAKRDRVNENLSKPHGARRIFG